MTAGSLAFVEVDRFAAPAMVGMKISHHCFFVGSERRVEIDQNRPHHEW